jgi:PAS domain S-box-containing protein
VSIDGCNPLGGGRRAWQTRTMTGSRVHDADLESALNRVSIPAYTVDTAGVVTWVNEAGRRIIGEARGRQFTSLVAPEETRHVREVFARKIAGHAPVTDFESVVIGADGQRIAVQISSVPLLDDERVVGIFGLVARMEEEQEPIVPLELTPRQHEVLRLLERGRSTDEIASELHLSRETVRNHINRLLRALGVKTRLQAVALAHGDYVN